MNLFEHLRDLIEENEHLKTKVNRNDNEIDAICKKHNINRQEMEKITFEIMKEID